MHSDDAATILRCAAASKALRAAVHGPGFRPRSRAALRAAVDAGFDPGTLLGVSYAHRDGLFVFGGLQPSQHHPRLDAGLLRSFEAVSSRDGLLVLWRREPAPELRVCNTLTGIFTSLPCMDVEGKWGNGGIYRPALLNLGRRAAGRRSFELLVMDVCFRTRIFSSRTGEWGAIRIIKPPPEHDSWCVIEEAMRTSPAVVGRTVHWVCRSTRSAAAGDVFVLALRVGVLQATAIEAPKRCVVSGTASCALTDAAGILRMVVSGTEAVSMWRLTSEERWSLEAVISKQQVVPGVDASRTVCWCVGENRGAVLLWMERIGLVQLNLGTKTARRDDATPVRLHEIDLASLLG